VQEALLPFLLLLIGTCIVIRIPFYSFSLIEFVNYRIFFIFILFSKDLFFFYFV
jgi:hypothetical protein